MNLAFLISAHTDRVQLKRLVGSLPKNSEFFVHIDKKTDIVPFAELFDNGNVHFIDERVDVRWGTILEVDYQMNLIAAAVAFDRHFDRIFFLSGLDYPIWSNSRIIRYLEESRNEETIMGIPLTEEIAGPVQFKNYSIVRPFVNIPFVGNAVNQKISKLLRIIVKALGFRKRLYLDVDGRKWILYKGAAWWCISERLAKYVVNTYTSNPCIRKYFKHQFCPAETLIQTIAFNSEDFRGKCILFDGFYETLASLTPLHYIDYGQQVKVLGEEDWDRIINSDKAFARKFRTGYSDVLMDKIDTLRSR